MQELLSVAWSYKLSILPVACAYFVFEISSIIRRFARIAYTPIYFLFFPLGHADSLYAQYFNEDEFYIGASQTPAEKIQVRNRIISISVFSMVFSTVLNPALAGFFTAIFLTQDQFLEFVWVLAITKIVLIIFSLYRTRHISFVLNSSSWPWLTLVYFVYFIFILRILLVSNNWVHTKVQKVGLLQALIDCLDLLVFDLGIYILIVALIGGSISYWMTNPDNIPELEVIEDPEIVKIEE